MPKLGMGRWRSERDSGEGLGTQREESRMKQGEWEESVAQTKNDLTLKGLKKTMCKRDGHRKVEADRNKDTEIKRG
jgi:hypothetical protein